MYVLVYMYIYVYSQLMGFVFFGMYGLVFFGVYNYGEIDEGEELYVYRAKVNALLRNDKRKKPAIPP